MRVTIDERRHVFPLRFSEKTKNDFYHRDNFTKYPGKYDYVQLDYNPSVLSLNSVDRSHLIRCLGIESRDEKGRPRRSEEPTDSRFQTRQARAGAHRTDLQRPSDGRGVARNEIRRQEESTR